MLLRMPSVIGRAVMGQCMISSSLTRCQNEMRQLTGKRGRVGQERFGKGGGFWLV